MSEIRKNALIEAAKALHMSYQVKAGDHVSWDDLSFETQIVYLIDAELVTGAWEVAMLEANVKMCPEVLSERDLCFFAGGEHQQCQEAWKVVWNAIIPGPS